MLHADIWYVVAAVIVLAIIGLLLVALGETKEKLRVSRSNELHLRQLRRESDVARYAAELKVEQLEAAAYRGYVAGAKRAIG